MTPLVVRAARDEDAEGLIALLGGVFAEYPGCVLDVDGEMPELRCIATTFARDGGEFWVAERGARVVGSVGWVPGKPGWLELKKLYVERGERRAGLGGTLVDRVLDAARAQGAGVELWSDTRFETAHAFYARRGWRRTGATRELHDRSATVEWHFVREAER